MNWLYALIAVLAILIIRYVSAYNKLVGLRQKVSEALSGIEVQLKRRYDLIPRLLETVKAYADHERQLLEGIAEERSRLVSAPAENLAVRGVAEAALGTHLKSVIALSEAYPDLKANQNFLKLQEQLAETEDQISASRRIYNGNVSLFNTKIESFPSNVVAALHGFKKSDFFDDGL